MPETLAALQGWMLDAIVTGRAPPGDGVRSRVEGDERLGAEGRLAVYAAGYRSRLMESLRDDYPALRLLVGETVFDLFAQGYLAARPPRHFSLYDLGAGFADHLDATRPADGGPLAALPAALARLERARAEVARAAGVERQPAAPPLAAAALLPGLALRLPDSVRLLRPAFDLLPLIEASDGGGEAVVPEAGDTPVAVARSGYRVRCLRLEPWRYAWLEALGSEGGDALASAAQAARASGREVGPTVADLALWLPRASALGLVV